MKWIKKDENTETLYADIEAAVVDFKCPCLCGPSCPLYDKVKMGDKWVQMCDKRYYKSHEEEVAALIGLKPYQEDEPWNNQIYSVLEEKKSLLDYTLREVVEIATNECEKHFKNCNECKLYSICGENPNQWQENIQKTERRILNEKELEYLRYAYKFGFKWISCDGEDGVLIHKTTPIWTDNKGFKSQEQMKSEFEFKICVGEYWGIQQLMEEQKYYV